MGGSLYPESLIRVHTDFLSSHVLGNTHSVSNRLASQSRVMSIPLNFFSSKLSLKCADEARAAVLSFFKASPEYTVVFTSNATAALKLVGESYPFTGGSSYVLGADSHNSVHGIREFATYRGARVCYIQSTPHGGFDPATAKVNTSVYARFFCSQNGTHAFRTCYCDTGLDRENWHLVSLLLRVNRISQTTKIRSLCWNTRNR